MNGGIVIWLGDYALTITLGDFIWIGAVLTLLYIIIIIVRHLLQPPS